MRPADAGSCLAARDERAALLAETLRQARGAASGAIVWMSTNVPGPDKAPPGLEGTFRRAAFAALTRFPGARASRDGVDVLGPYLAISVAGEPAGIKHEAVALEEETPERRLIDVDVVTAAGFPVDRVRLGLPQRACLVCDEPARDCIRIRRHPKGELAAAVAARLAPEGSPDALARNLVAGARIELDLTPKPGLVDRRDNGSHYDLSHELMARSISLLPAYYDDLLTLRRAGTGLEACVDAGRRAERRMFDALATNAHRGYIFLSGLLLIAACDAERAARDGELCRAPGSTRAATLLDQAPGNDCRCGAALSDVRHRLRAAAREFFGRSPTSGTITRSNGARALASHGIGGIRSEALAGLPSVFDTGLPALADTLRLTGDLTLASYALLAVLMQRVDDTTALHRCGPAGLARLRRDGATLEGIVATGADPVPFLEAWNNEYRQMALTMGGVADCMALTLALYLHSARPASAGAL